MNEAREALAQCLEIGARNGYDLGWWQGCAAGVVATLIVGLIISIVQRNFLKD